MTMQAFNQQLSTHGLLAGIRVYRHLWVVTLYRGGRPVASGTGASSREGAAAAFEALLSLGEAWS